MILRHECGGRKWSWVEKGNSASLLVDVDTNVKKLVWSGCPRDPSDLIFLNRADEKVPMELLLFFSTERVRVGLT